MEPTAIQFRNVSKSFGEEAILRDFDLTIARGEFVSIVGPSGCGKSTVLRMIAGLEGCDAGQLLVSALDSGSSGQREALRSRTATSFVFQDSNLLPWLTTIDNVALPFRITGLPVDRERIAEVLELVGLPAASHAKYPAQLSGGMKMRVSIARALVTDPSTLLLDEPFAALDDLLRTSLNVKLMDIWQRDRQTMLFVTHNIAEAVFMSQRVLVMQRGIRTPKSVTIDFEYPRPKSIRSSRAFAEAYTEVSGLLEETGSLEATEVQG